MPHVHDMSLEELEARRAEILDELGMTYEELAAKAGNRSLIGDPVCQPQMRHPPPENQWPQGGDGDLPRDDDDRGWARPADRDHRSWSGGW